MPYIEPRIAVSVIRGLRLPIQEHNLDFSSLLLESGIDESALHGQQGKIPLRCYLKFMELAAGMAQDPLLGVRLARSCGPETLGAVGFLLLSSRTLVDGIKNLCTYLNLLQDTTSFQFTHDKDHLSFIYELYGVPDMDCRQDVEFSIALTARLIRMFGGAELKEISYVSFRHAASAPINDYERLLQCAVQFNQESNCIHLPGSMATLQGHALEPELGTILKSFLDTELQRRNRVQSLTDQVYHILIGNRIKPPITASRMASYLGLSPSTFYRRLKSEGDSFSNILEKVQFELACNYLAESTLSITQIAHIIGFSELASFTRAFSRWTAGITPSRYRRSVTVTERQD